MELGGIKMQKPQLEVITSGRIRAQLIPEEDIASLARMFIRILEEKKKDPVFYAGLLAYRKQCVAKEANQ